MRAEEKRQEASVGARRLRGLVAISHAHSSATISTDTKNCRGPVALPTLSFVLIYAHRLPRAYRDDQHPLRSYAGCRSSLCRAYSQPRSTAARAHTPCPHTDIVHPPNACTSLPLSRPVVLHPEQTDTAQSWRLKTTTPARPQCSLREPGQCPKPLRPHVPVADPTTTAPTAASSSSPGCKEPSRYDEPAHPGSTSRQRSQRERREHAPTVDGRGRVNGKGRGDARVPHAYHPSEGLPQVTSAVHAVPISGSSLDSGRTPDGPLRRRNGTVTQRSIARHRT